MSISALTELPQLTGYEKRARKLLGERYANSRSDEWKAATVLAQFIKSIDRLFVAISKGLPENNLIIEDMMIKGDEIVVRYRAGNSPKKDLMGFLPDVQSFAVNSIDILRIDDGRVTEHWDTVYQVKA